MYIASYVDDNRYTHSYITAASYLYSETSIIFGELRKFDIAIAS